MFCQCNKSHIVLEIIIKEDSIIHVSKKAATMLKKFVKNHEKKTVDFPQSFQNENIFVKIGEVWGQTSVFFFKFSMIFVSVC